MDADEDGTGGGALAPPPFDKDLLISLCTGLCSYHEDSEGRLFYVAASDCVECLKDLQRFLRKDDRDTRDVFFQLCEYGTVRNDVLPILTHYAASHEHVFNAIKVLTFLTMPISATSARTSMQATYLRQFKEEVVRAPDVLAILCGEVAEALSRHPRMNDEHTATVQVCLTLLRNLLAIQDDVGHPGAAGGPTSGGGGGAVAAAAPGMGSLHARFLAALFEADALELLTALVQLAGERPFKDDVALLLDIVHEVVRGLDAAHLARCAREAAAGGAGKAGAALAGGAGPPPAAADGLAPQQSGPPAAAAQQQRSGGGGHNSRVAAGMQAILDAEKARKARLLRHGPRMHSRDTGRYVRVHDDHDAKVILGTNASANELPPLQLVAPASSKDGWESGAQGQARPSLPVALAARMHAWMLQFAGSGAYNSLMEVARREAEAGFGISRLEPPDVCRMMRVARTFLACTRVQHESRVRQRLREQKARSAEGGAAAAERQEEPFASAFAGVSSTLSWSTFHLVHTRWLAQVDAMAKSPDKNWEVQYCSLSLLREMLLVLEAAEASPNEHDSKAADSLQRRLLHDDMKETGLLPVLCKSAKTFNARQVSHAHAIDIIMCLHSVVRMLDRLTSADAGGFTVKRKTNAGGGGGSRAKQAHNQEEEEEQGGAPGEGEEGGGSKDGDAEGKGGEAEKEKEEKEEGSGEGGGAGGGEARGKERRVDPFERLAEDGEEEDQMDEEERRRRFKEVQLDLNRRLMQEMGQGAMVHFLVMQGAAHYRHNSGDVNKAIAALLWRIASPTGLDLEALMYQVSVLRVMHMLLSDRGARGPSRLSDCQDLLVLATRVTRNLFAKLCPAPASEADLPESLREKKEQEDAAAPSGAQGRRKGEEGDSNEGEEEEDEVAKLAALADEGDDDEEGKKGAKEREKEERAKARKEFLEREDRVRRGISSMLFIDLLFWKTPQVAHEIREDYLLRVDVEALAPKRRVGAGRGQRAADAPAGREDEEEGRGGGGGEGEGEGEVRPRLTGPSVARRRTGVQDWEDDDDDGADGGGRAGPAGGAGVAGRLPVEEEGGGGHEGPQDAPAEGAGRPAAAAGAAAAKQQRQRDLAEEAKQRRRALEAQQKAARRMVLGGGGRGGGGRGRAGEGGGLAPEEQEELLAEFQRLNAHRVNADLLLQRLGGEWTKNKVSKALKAMGLKFGHATEAQVEELRALWEAHGSTGDMQGALLMVAAQMSGGWTAKQVRSLLKQHGMLAKGQRGGPGKIEAALGGLDEQELREAFERHSAGAAPSDVAELVSAELGVSRKAVLKALQGLGLIEASRRRRGEQGGARHVDEALLLDLYDEHHGKPDMLNLVAAGLGGAVDALEVSKLLVRCGAVQDEAAASKAARAAAERAQLVALYQRHRVEEDYLQRMADDMTGVTTAREVIKLMRKHGLLEPEPSGRRRGAPGLGASQARGGEGEEEEEGGDTAAQEERGGLAGAAAAALQLAGSSRAARDPDGDQVLACLAAMDAVTGKRWMEPAAAVAWLCRRLDAAEGLWRHVRGTGGGGGAMMDYSLTMETEEDESFFMADFAQELLEAAGMRNDAGDFFKVPGNSDASWRQRVRDALHAALEQLGTERAAELRAKLADELTRRQAEQARRQEEERERQAAAFAAVSAAAVQRRRKGGAAAAARGRGAGKPAARGGAGKAGRGGAAAEENAAAAEPPRLERDSSDGDGDGERAASLGAEAAAPRVAKPAAAAPKPAGRLSRMMKVESSDSDSESSSSSSRDGGSDGACAAASSGSGGEDSDVPAAARGLARHRRPSQLPIFSSSSEDEDGGDAHQENRGGGPPPPPMQQQQQHAKKKSRTAAAAEPAAAAPAGAAAERTPHSTAQRGEPSQGEQEEEEERRGPAGGRSGGKKRVPTVSTTASQRNAALQALMAKRQHHHHHQQRSPLAALQPAAPRPTAQQAGRGDEEAAGGGRGEEEGGAARGKRRRLLHPAGAAGVDAAPLGAEGPVVLGAAGEDDLEDF